jgi:hypothetical protein
VKSVTSHGMHWGELGQQVTGIPVVHLTDGLRVAHSPWSSRYFSALQFSSGPRYTRNYVPVQGSAPEVPRLGHLLGRGRAPGRRWDFWKSSLAGGWDYRCLVRGGDLLLRQRPRSAAKSVSRFVGATRL